MRPMPPRRAGGIRGAHSWSMTRSAVALGPYLVLAHRLRDAGGAPLLSATSFLRRRRAHRRRRSPLTPEARRRHRCRRCRSRRGRCPRIGNRQLDPGDRHRRRGPRRHRLQRWLRVDPLDVDRRSHVDRRHSGRVRFCRYHQRRRVRRGSGGRWARPTRSISRTSSPPSTAATTGCRGGWSRAGDECVAR